MLSPYLIAELHLSARSLGLVTSIYFFTSAVFQVPLGLFMDRYGPRRVQGWMMLLATLGVVDVRAQQRCRRAGRRPCHHGDRRGGRADDLLPGGGAVVPARAWPAINGWIMAAGGVGGLFASMPTALALHVADWHGLMLMTAAASVLAAIAIFAIVPERVRDTPPPGIGEQIYGLASIYRDRLFWRLAPVAACAAGSNLAFGGLWAGPWLKDVAGLGPDGIGLSLLFFTTLIVIGFIVSGMVASWLGRRGICADPGDRQHVRPLARCCKRRCCCRAVPGAGW